MTQNESDRIVSAETWVDIVLYGGIVVGILGLGGMIVAWVSASDTVFTAIGALTVILMISMVLLAFGLEVRMVEGKP